MGRRVQFPPPRDEAECREQIRLLQRRIRFNDIAILILLGALVLTLLLLLCAGEEEQRMKRRVLLYETSRQTP